MGGHGHHPKPTWQRLTRAMPGKTQAELAKKYTHSQALVSVNNQVLTLMADREEKLSGDCLFDLQYLRAGRESTPAGNLNFKISGPGSWRPSSTAWN